MLFKHQVKFMKRIAEMSDLSQAIRALPRIKKHLLNPDNMRWAHFYIPLSCWSRFILLLSLQIKTVCSLQVFSERDSAENVRRSRTAGEFYEGCV